jgi:ribonuclease D
VSSELNTNQFLHITTQQQLEDFCRKIADEGEIAFDTEFVSEDTYENHLCLLQIASRKSIAVVDTLQIDDLNCFWQLITDSKSTVIAHAAREEFCFSYRALRQPIANLFDVQIAAGMVGMEYPASYGTLVGRVSGLTLDKGETRTNWRKRPLTQHQIQYALRDVLYLHQIYDFLQRELTQLQRTDWCLEEMVSWQTSLIDAITGELWRRLPGVSRLSPRVLETTRQLWEWRDSYARQRDRPARRILRDDLLIELAKRGSDDPQRIRAIRGMERRDYSQHIDDIAACVKRAHKVQLEECPPQIKKQGSPPVNLLAQFLSTALAAICRDARIAPQIVGTNDDIRQWLGYRMKRTHRSSNNQPAPALGTGWRAEIIGKQLDGLLEGKLGLRIADARADQPLTIARVDK